MRVRIWLGLTGVAAILGLLFASVSTYDFVAHLDRQVHGLHCSFLPGVASSDPAAAAGCQATMMSPYSSVFRDELWGGIPVSLPAMGVFAFLLFFSAFIALRGRESDSRATGFLLLATLLPVLASAVMGYLALTELHAVCKLCVGIYVSSGLAFLGALGAFLSSRAEASDLGGVEPMTGGLLTGAFALGVLFVAVPTMAYAANAPEFERYVGACGELAVADDPHGVMVPLGSQAPGVPVTEILDPLCPSCRAFEGRFSALETAKPTRRSAVLFPLDDECNWMVADAIHPGACAISEAILCAEDRADAVLEWAFEEQERIVEASRADPEAAARMAKARFPALAECIGSPHVRARLNAGLRWAVDNQIPVLTPQVYVGNTRVCDEDTDLGVDFVLARLIDRVPVSPRPPRSEQPLELVDLGGSRRPGSAPSEAGQPVLTQGATAPVAPGAEPSPAAAGAPSEATPTTPTTPSPAEPAEPAATPTAAPAAGVNPAAETAAPPPEPPPAAAPAAPAAPETSTEPGATP